MEQTETHSIFPAALKYSIPVFFGYIAIGTAFGLLMADAGYPWWVSLIMSVIMFAGSGQYIAVGLFAAGAGIAEAALIQLVVNARHIAYSMSMLNRYKNAGVYKFYLIFGLTDETFALLSSLPQTAEAEEKSRFKFMFYVTALNQSYWITGTLVGAITGSLIPFNTEGIGFALTAMFVVLMMDKIFLAQKTAEKGNLVLKDNLGVFIIPALIAVLSVVLLPARVSLLCALVIALVLAFVVGKKHLGTEK